MATMNPTDRPATTVRPVVGWTLVNDRDRTTVRVVAPRTTPGGRTWGWTVRGVDGRYGTEIAWNDFADRDTAVRYAFDVARDHDVEPDAWTVTVDRPGDARPGYAVAYDGWHATDVRAGADRSRFAGTPVVNGTAPVDAVW